MGDLYSAWPSWCRCTSAPTTSRSGRWWNCPSRSLPGAGGHPQRRREIVGSSSAPGRSCCPGLSLGWSMPRSKCCRAPPGRTAGGWPPRQRPAW